MRKHFVFMALAGLSVASACTAPNGQIAGLYNKAVCQIGSGSDTECSAEPDAVASLVTIETQPATPPTTGTTLLGRAQAEYIRALEKWSKSAKDLRENLAEKVTATEASSADERTFKRTLIVDIRKAGAFNPVDRLESIRIVIKLTNAQFTNWDTAATNYTTISAGTAQLTNIVGSSGALTAGTPSAAPVAASLSGNLSQSSSRVENYTEGFQLENLTVSVDTPLLNSKKEIIGIMRIQRQGGPGVDLTGTVVVKLEIYLPAQTERTTYAADRLFSPNGEPIAPNKAILSARTHSVPDLAHLSSDGSLLADVSGTYVVRHVLTHGGTGVPAKQDVRYHTKNFPEAQNIFMRRQDILPLTYGIYSGAAFLVAARPGGVPRPMCFVTYDAASDFLRYLRATGSPTKVGSVIVGSSTGGPGRLSHVGAHELEGYIVKGDCD